MKKNCFFIVVMLLSLSPCTAQKATNNVKTEESTGLEKNKSIARNVFKQLINERNLAAVNELYSSAMIDHSAFEGEKPGAEGFKQSVKDFIEMFPDLKVTVEEIIAEGDKVATRESWRGTHAKSNKVVTGETVHIFTIANGKITDEWSKGWEWLENL